MANRVATSAGINRVGADLARTFNRMSEVQSQITSGKRLQRPSDNPAQVAVALEGRAAQRRLEQHTANATDAAGWIRVTDDTLVGLQEQATQAKVRLTAAVNGGNDATSLAAIAKDIENVRSSMIELANQSYQGRPIFGGTAAATSAPYTAAGVYVDGHEGTVYRTIDDGVTLAVNVSTPAIFGTRNEASPLSGDVFQVLDVMATAARTGDAAGMSASLTALTGAMDRMSEAQIQVGGASVQVDNTINRNEMMMTDVKDRLSSIEDVDLAESIITLKSSEAAYQAALAVTARVIQPSLLDFLR
jgi:flagellar hook-associated protein 3 FlgL